MSKLEWVGESPSSSTGITFAVPWAQGQSSANRSSVYCLDPSGHRLPSQCWNTAYWPDGSVKWTGHALPALSQYPTSISVDCIDSAYKEESALHSEWTTPIRVLPTSEIIRVDTGKIRVFFPKSGNSVIGRIENCHSGKVVAENGHLVLRSQSSFSVDDEVGSSTQVDALRGIISKAEIESEGQVRVVIRVEGKHQNVAGFNGDRSSPDWLPFILRFYIYANSDSIRIVHTIIYDQDPQSQSIRGIGVRFNVLLKGEAPYDRHVRMAGVEGGIFGEAVQGVTGLWKEPGIKLRQAQVSGQPTPGSEEWNPEFASRQKWIPHWNDFTLSQSSPDGYNMKKRTKVGHSWVNIPGGTKADGLVYLGGATNGGLGIGMRHFWERYPTQIDIRNADTDSGEITMWLYSPAAEPLDMRPYHDGLGQETYDEQLDALQITYEDWEPGTGTPCGIARTNELLLCAFEHTPSNEDLSRIIRDMRNPPLLVAQSEYIHATKAFGQYWAPFSSLSPPDHGVNPGTNYILHNLDFLFKFYKGQIAQRRWYGFWDHGDIMHTYDADRHTWRYDIGGYAWDNSELSPDLWLWLYFLCTRRKDVFQMAESLTRHTSEVDMYHLGRFKGLGTRHGVQHWSDSCKQARVSNVLYRKYFYYLTGGDERMGEVIRETLEVEKTLLVLDPYRKVRKDRGYAIEDPETGFLISLGTDWSALAAGWMLEWERRGPQWEYCRRKLIASIKGIVELKNGFVTGQARLHTESGRISPPPADIENRGHVQVSHLSAMFGLVETCAELVDVEFVEEDDRALLKQFQSAWLDYCVYYNASSEMQISRYGVSFPKLILRQGHSRLTAYAARILKDPQIARRAWKEFYEGDGYAPSLPWRTELINGSQVPVHIDEANWVSTNITALYGLAAIQGLAFGAEYLHD
jgi:YetA-like protein